MGLIVEIGMVIITIYRLIPFYIVMSIFEIF